MKETYSFVTYSDESAELLSIGFMVYSDKSICLTVNMNKDRKDMKKKDLIMLNEIKTFLGKERDDEKYTEDSLKGTGNTRLKDAEGDSFWGYIYSISGGSRAIRWFAERSTYLPSQEETKAKAEEESEELSEAEIRQRSAVVSFNEVKEQLEAQAGKKKKELTEEEIREQATLEGYNKLVQIIGDLTGNRPKDTTKKTASKYQKPPHLVKGLTKEDIPPSPKKASLPIKQKAIAGVPSRKSTPAEKSAPVEEKDINQDDIDAAFKTIFTAIRLGLIQVPEDTEDQKGSYIKEYIEEASSTENEPQDSDILPSPFLYKGLIGDVDSVKAQIKRIKTQYPQGEYGPLIQVGPKLILQLVSHRKDSLEL